MRNSTSIQTTSNIPETPGVYFLKNKDNEIVYIGKARNLRSRVTSHKQSKDSFKNVEPIHSVEWVQLANEIEALIKEREYIQHYQPKLNVLLRDDKQYLYIGVTKQEYPRIFTTHQPLLNKRQNAVKSEYIGPFTDATAVKKTLRYLRKSFPFYMTTAKQATRKQQHSPLACPYCHLNLCPGPDPDKQQYRQTITTLRRIFTGKYPFVIKNLKKQVQEHSKKQEFEKAAVLQKQYNALYTVFHHHAPVSAPNPKRILAVNEPAQYLAWLLNVELPIFIIEGYDISNFQGKESVASVVRFEKGQPNKSLYRSMNIRSAGDEPNDFLSLQEALRRRFAHTEWSYPDLVLLDGGRGQLTAGVAQLKQLRVTVPIVALAKKQEELYIPGRRPMLLSKMPEDVQYLLQSVRNEAHRFAITRHRARHRKTFRTE